MGKHKAIMPYLGGKSKLAPLLAQKLMAYKHTCYVEAFAGSAKVFYEKAPSKSEVINDINKDIINLYRVVQNHLEEFMRFFKWALVARDEFDRLSDQNPESLTDIQRAARFWYLQKNAFGGKLGGTLGTATTSPPRFNLLRIEEDLSQAHIRLARVNMECLSWDKVILKYDRPHSLFYLDPPYFGCEDDYGKGLFAREDFIKMAVILKNLKGNFILSLNDTKEVRNIFKDFTFEEVTLNYSIGKTRSKKANELFITK